MRSSRPTRSSYQRRRAGFTATGLDGSTGTQTVADGAEIIVRMAQAGPDGPTGGYVDVKGPLPW